MLQTYEALKASIRTIPDYPEPGINFRDISTLISHADLFHEAIYGLAEPYMGQVDEVVSIEARGLVFGPPIAFGRMREWLWLANKANYRLPQLLGLIVWKMVRLNWKYPLNKLRRRPNSRS